MQTRFTKNWVLAVAVAAMLGGSSFAVRAQDTTVMAPADSTTTSTTTTTTTGAMSGGMMNNGMSGDMSSGITDFSILSNRNYDYKELMGAKARGLSDSQIATVSKIAKETYMPFNEVAMAVERGETFPMIATKDNLRLSDIYDVDTEKQEIANYIAAYEATGTKGGMMGDMMMDDMKKSDMSGDMGDMKKSDNMDNMKPMDNGMAMTPTMDIVDSAMAAPNLSTLVKALQVAGLVDTLKGAGPFTVFAPNNRAFSRLPKGTLDALMADPAKLKSILSYHVISGAKVTAADAMGMATPTSPATVEGGTLQVTKGNRGGVMINDARVVKADIMATNGIIHIIDKVLMPMDNMGTGTTTTGTTDSTTTTTTTTTAPAAQ